MIWPLGWPSAARNTSNASPPVVSSRTPLRSGRTVAMVLARRSVPSSCETVRVFWRRVLSVSTPASFIKRVSSSSVLVLLLSISFFLCRLFHCKVGGGPNSSVAICSAQASASAKFRSRRFPVKLKKSSLQPSSARTRASCSV